MKAARGLPSIIISKGDFDHLVVIALDAEHCGDPNARFLKSELQRAILFGRSVVPQQVVMIDCGVSYRLGGCSEIQHRVLVRPHDSTRLEEQVSAGSYPDIALIGFGAGARLPFLDSEMGNTQKVEVDASIP